MQKSLFASRRSLDRVSVPVCLIVLSNQILIVALVSHYLTNKLISRELLFRQINLFHSKAYGVLATVSSCCPPPKGKFLRVTHPSATWVKDSRTTCMCKASRHRSSWARIKLSLNFHKFVFVNFVWSLSHKVNSYSNVWIRISEILKRINSLNLKINSS